MGISIGSIQPAQFFQSWLFGGIVGMLIGWILMVLGTKKNQKDLALTGFCCCVVAGSAGGLILAMPTGALFLWLIQRAKNKPRVVVSRRADLNRSEPIAIGYTAPDFTLKSKQVAGLVDVKLSNNFGRKNTVLLFVTAFSPASTKELSAISADSVAYAKLDADVIAISVDNPFAQAAWAQKERITVTLASDLNKEVIENYGVVFSSAAMGGDLAASAAFVIDKNGVLQYAERTPMPKDLPNFDRVKETLAKLV